MTRYQPLQQHLAQQTSREHPMTFREIESVIGSSLPASARSHRPWWSNSHGTNPAAQAWRAAGRKTAQVDMAGERVVFIRDESPPVLGSITFSESGGPERDEVILPLSRLSGAARRLFEAELEAHRGDRVEAVVALLNRAAIARKLATIDDLRKLTRPGGPDSADLVREDRDVR